jgi:hypothetical protein
MKRSVLIPALLLIVLSVFFLWPLLRPGFIATDDGDWMIIRLSAFYQSFREGQFPVRLLGRLNYSYGYPVANFLYPGFMYIGSVIHALGIPFVETIKIILIGSVITAVVGVYMWLLRYTSVVVSFIASVVFLFSPYVAFDIFRRGSVGEVLAIASIAVVLYALESGKRHVVTVAVACLILSHNSVAFLSLPFLVLYGLLRKQWYVIISTVLALGLSAFFWIPALMERRYVQFNLVKVSNPFEYFSIQKSWFLITIPHIIALVFFFAQYKKHSVFARLTAGAFILITFMTLPVSGFFWSIDSFAKLFQFPYRFLSMSLFTGSLLYALVLDSQIRSRQYIAGVLSLLVLLPSLFLSYKQITRTFQPETFYTTNEATTTVANEYLPRWVREPAAERTPQEIEFFQGKGTIKIQELNTQKVAAFIKAEENSIIQINSVYYPGWGVLVNNVPIPINYDNPKGVIRFAIPAGEHNIRSEFRETVSRFATNIISLISIVIFTVSLVVPQRIKNNIFRSAVLLMKEPMHDRKQQETRKKRI